MFALAIKGETYIIVWLASISYSSQISTTDFTKKRRQITRMKLAAEVTKSVGKFITVRPHKIILFTSNLMYYVRERNRMVMKPASHNAAGETYR